MSRGTLPLAFAFPVCILRMGSSALALPLLPPDGPSQVCACSLHSTPRPLLASAVLWATVGKADRPPALWSVGAKAGGAGCLPRAGRTTAYQGLAEARSGELVFQAVGTGSAKGLR